MRLSTTNQWRDRRNGEVTSVNVQFQFGPTLDTCIGMARVRACRAEQKQMVNGKLFWAEEVQVGKETKLGPVFWEGGM